MDVSYITFANARSRDHWNHPEMEIIEDNGDHESNKSLNIKKSNWFLTTDKYENVQDETEIANEATEHQNSEAYLVKRFKKQRWTILLHPGIIFSATRRKKLENFPN